MERRIALLALIGMCIGAVPGEALGAAGGNTLPRLGYRALFGAGLGWFIVVAVTKLNQKL